MNRFICMHETEAGFSSEKEAQAWVDAQDDNSAWRVVAINFDAATRTIVEDRQTQLIDAAFQRGVQSEKARVMALLGLG